MALTTFSGPIKSLSGFIDSGFNSSVDATAALSGGALTLTVAAHAGKQLTVSADGGTFTLPTIVATNPGDTTDPNQTSNLGMQFQFTVLELLTTSLIIETGALTDLIYGTVRLADDANDEGASGTFSSATTNTITLNGGTQGGQAGSVITITAVSAAAWKVEGTSVFPTASTPATPFSTRV
tara:strand:- start:25 stop:567 length:543 start_codon:yes stop_codon:yes gene_type:complete